jgi:hypothetical protein
MKIKFILLKNPTLEATVFYKNCRKHTIIVSFGFRPVNKTKSAREGYKLTGSSAVLE